MLTHAILASLAVLPRHMTSSAVPAIAASPHHLVHTCASAHAHTHVSACVRTRSSVRRMTSVADTSGDTGPGALRTRVHACMRVNVHTSMCTGVHVRMRMFMRAVRRIDAKPRAWMPVRTPRTIPSWVWANSLEHERLGIINRMQPLGSAVGRTDGVDVGHSVGAIDGACIGRVHARVRAACGVRASPHMRMCACMDMRASAHMCVRACVRAYV